MVHPNRQEIPQHTDPVELELIALHNVAIEPVSASVFIGFMGGAAVVATLEANAAQDPS